MKNLFLVSVLSILTLSILSFPIVSSAIETDGGSCYYHCDPEDAESGQCYCTPTSDGGCAEWSPTQDVEPSDGFLPALKSAVHELCEDAIIDPLRTLGFDLNKWED